MYNFKEIEKKWQSYWESNNTFKAITGLDKSKYYILVEFPYPSGVGLHVGHVKSYTALDAVARYKRLKGYNVLFPMGWDAFGAPAEQYAIKNHIHPSEAVKRNINTFKTQIQKLGISFDWDREVATTDPEYYKWTQWQFLKFFEHNMAYKAKKNINWCPKCKTGLSNEDSSGGICERCGSKVIQKEKEQWILRMSDYAESLLAGLNDTKFCDRVKLGQINWIGKSIGAEIDFKLDNVNTALKVFTTRPDTLFGVTFMVIAPEHPLINDFRDKISNYDELLKYKEKSNEKTAFERTELAFDKTGVKVEGLMAINPVNNKKIEIWVSDYVMMNYGTGAIMAVPAHDERDYAFAKKFNIDIIPVIKGDGDDLPYTGDGIHINSDFINNLDKENAINKMIAYLEENKIGNKKVNYRLQDWIFSRQRFWGEPIPIINCEHCGYVPVPYKDLPVTLPEVQNYEPTDDGESPLASISSWVNVTCPKCGKMAKRETDTMPNWAGSSWYYLRYMDPHNNEEFASLEALNYWHKVDWYNGGMEHTARHLLYARFWNQFLYNIGLVPNKEPFDVRVSHGMILGANGEKMAKSKPEFCVDPNNIISEYGADALRTYEMFIGDYEKDAIWNENGLKGCKRFLDRVYRLKEKLNEEETYSTSLEKIINQTIKKVGDDLNNIKYNTAVSSLMILLNEMEKKESISKKDYQIFLLLLNPIAPHITEELNEKCALGIHLCECSWPKYDKNNIENDSFEMVVQVSGKVRGKIAIDSNVSKEEMEKLALELDNVKKYITDKQIVKIITIPKKLVNIVVK